MVQNIVYIAAEWIQKIVSQSKNKKKWINCKVVLYLVMYIGRLGNQYCF